jgi:hypothetical protein
MSADMGPCAPWDPIWSCDVSTSSPTATGYAASMATRVLWGLTGRRFGQCTVTWRPCRRECYPDWGLPGQLPGYGMGLLDYGYSGAYWTALSCGSCVGRSCSCGRVPEIYLPAPVDHIVTVKMDGTPMATGGYRLDETRILVRTDGQDWPRCNDLTKDDTQAGTWSVTAVGGEPVPTGGQLAAGELGCEILKAMRGEDCRLPAGVTQLVRQGVTISIPDFGDILMHGRTGLYLCDMFIMSENPKHLQQRGRAYSVDRPRMRRQG